MADGTAPQCGRVGSCHILLKSLNNQLRLFYTHNCGKSYYGQFYESFTALLAELENANFSSFIIFSRQSLSWISFFPISQVNLPITT